jgi:integrase
MTRQNGLPKYVTRERDRKTGKAYVYFRRRGRAKVRILDAPESEAFKARYLLLLQETAHPSPPQRIVTAPRSFGWLVRLYTGSVEFRRLDPRTQYVRRRVLEDCLGEPPARSRGRSLEFMPVRSVTGKAVRALRDRKAVNADGKPTPEAANARVKALRQVFAYGVAAEHVDKNPARDIPYLTNGSDGFHSWTGAEVAQYEDRHPIGTKARLALALLLYTGQRRSDIVLFGRQHVTKGWIRFTQQKNRNRRPITLEIPVRPELQAVIDRSPVGDLTFLVTEFGRGFTAPGFGNWFRKRCDEAGLPHCSAHGLRKAAATRLAEAGATEQQIMAITGHTTSKEVVRYTKAARQRVMAGQAFGLLASKTVRRPFGRGGRAMILMAAVGILASIIMRRTMQ